VIGRLNEPVFERDAQDVVEGFIEGPLWVR
jgi:hypothetical protein